MNIYNKDAFCTKCGGVDISSNYHRESLGCSMYSSPCSWIKVEHILRHCRNCHWEWGEKPLNIEEEKPKPIPQVPVPDLRQWGKEDGFAKEEMS